MSTLKAKVLDLVEKEGPKTWKELLVFMLNQKGLSYEPHHRGRYSSYFSGSSLGLYYYLNRGMPKSEDDFPLGRSPQKFGLLMRPTQADPRYLEKVNGKYELRRV